MAVSFIARLRGTTPGEASYVEVPLFVMRRLSWGRYVHVVARLNDKHEMPATIINVGWGPSFLVPPQARRLAGVGVDTPVSISLRER